MGFIYYLSKEEFDALDEMAEKAVKEVSNAEILLAGYVDQFEKYGKAMRFEYLIARAYDWYDSHKKATLLLKARENCRKLIDKSL